MRGPSRRGRRMWVARKGLDPFDGLIYRPFHTMTVSSPWLGKPRQAPFNDGLSKEKTQKDSRSQIIFGF